MSPFSEAKLRADINVYYAGGDKSQNRSIYSLYNAQSVKQAASSRKDINQVMAEKMDENAKHTLEQNNVMVMSRINNTSWKY